MKKLLFIIIISMNIFANTDKSSKESEEKSMMDWKNPEKTWTRPFAPSFLLSYGTGNGETKFKGDFRALLLGYNLKSRYFQTKGLAFGLGSSYISSEGFSTYLESTYGTYGFNQFNGRVRLGLTNKGDLYTGFSITKSFTYIIYDTSLDLLHKKSGTESLITFGMGLGF